METAVTSVDIMDWIMDWVLFFLPSAIRPICTRLLQIIGTLVLCWILIRVSSRVVKSFLQRQTKKQYMPITERKANTLNSIICSVLKYAVYFIGIFSILNYLGFPGI